MRALFVSALLAPALLASCGGCAVPFGIPFAHEVEATMRLSLGAVDPFCAASGEEERDNGDVVTYRHALVGEECRMRATWRGLLVDMPAVRAGVDEALAAEGLDPSSVEITITHLVPEVEAVSLRDARGHALELELPALEGYRGSISVEGEPEVIVIEMPAGGDPSEPETTTKDSPVLAALATEAYAEELPVEGEGEAEVRVRLDRLTPVAIADDPALVVELRIVVEGEATVVF